MARQTDIRLRRSAVSGAVPGSADLNLGELALNTADGAIYVKNGSNNIVTVSHDGILHYDQPNSRIGIGTSTPAQTLHLTNTGFAYARLNNSSYTGVDIGQHTNGNIYINNRDNTSIVAMTNNTERLRIDSSGNVGIGTGSPSELLEIAGVVNSTSTGIAIKNGSATRLRIFHNDNGGASYISSYDVGAAQALVIRSGNNLLLSGGGGTEHARIDTSGRLLLNATSTAFSDKLYVNGDAYVTGGWRVGTGATYTGKIYNSAGVMAIETDSNRDIKLGSATYPNILYIDSSTQYVGIGTSTPRDLLDIVSSTSDARLVLDAAAGFDPELKFFEAGAVKFTVGHDSATSKFVIGTSNVDTQKRFTIDTSGAITFNEAYTFPTTIGTAGQILKVPSVGTDLVWASDAGGGSATILTDTDSDTKIQVEESADEDKIRFDAAGVERFRIGSDVEVIAATDFNITGSNRRINFTSGTGTVRTSGAYSLNLGTNSADRLTITSAGNVGIGTSAPTTSLHVEDDNANSWSATTDWTVQTSDSLALVNTSNIDGDQITSLYMRASGNGGNASARQVLRNIGSGSGEIHWQMRDAAHTTTTNDKMILKSSGELGIGISPTEKLHVAGDVSIGTGGTGGTASLKFVNDNERSRITSNYDAGGGGRLGFWTDTSGGTLLQRLTINNSGNVGIGTTTPSEKLQVNGNIALYGELKLVHAIRHANSGAQVIDNDDDTYFIINDPEGSNRIKIGDSGDASNTYRNTTHKFEPASGTEYMRINATGVGIGTTAPGTPLDVQSNSSAEGIRVRGRSSDSIGQITLTNNGGTARSQLQWNDSFFNIKALAAIPMIFYTNSTERMRIDSSGNVGIGTSSPTSALDVNGTVTADGIQLDSNDQYILAGAGAGLKIGHDASSSIIRSQVGPMYIDGNGITFRGYSPYTKHMDIATNGDVSFYEDTGTTAKLFWDSSTSRLSLGHTAPTQIFHIKTAVINTAHARIESTAANSYPTLSLKNDVQEYQLTAHGGLSDDFTIYDGTAGVHRLRINTLGHATFSGNVTSPQLKIEGTEPILFFNDTTTGHDDWKMYADWDQFNIQQFVNDTTWTSRLHFAANGNATFSGIVAADGLTVSNGTNTTTIPATSDRVSFTGASLNYLQSAGHLFVQPTGDLVLNGTGAEIMRLKSGKVGIGTSAPAALLDVSADALIHSVKVGRGAGAVTSNTVVGAYALATNTTGSSNTAIGNWALNKNLTAQGNTAVGKDAAYNTSTGNLNTAVGSAALYSNVSGSNITAIGNGALRNTTSSNNTGLGYQAGYNNTTGSGNVYVGNRAGHTATGNSNVIVNGTGSTTANSGSGNVFIGNSTGNLNTTGSGNTFVGAYVYNVGSAGSLMTTGSKNTILGAFSGNRGGLDIRTADNFIVLSDGDGNARQVIDSSGNVGIGTTAPATTLDITTSGVNGVLLNQDTVSAATSARLMFKDNVRTNLLINVNGILQFRTDAAVNSSSGTTRFSVSPTLVNSEVPFRVEEYQINTTTTSSAATTQIAVHTFPAADFRSAKYTIQVTNTTDSTYHITEILMIHNGTTPSITEYGTIFTGTAAEATFDADILTGNVRLLATPAAVDGMQFKVVCHSITV